MQTASLLWLASASVIAFSTSALAETSANNEDAPIVTAPRHSEQTVWDETLPTPAIIESHHYVEIGEPKLPRRTREEPRCLPMAEFGVEQGRMVERLGLDVADGEPTAHGKGQWTCGMITYGGEFSRVISENTNRGARRLGDEVRFDVMVHPEFSTRFGRFQPRVGAAYMFQDNSQGMLTIADDYTELMIGGAHLSTYGSLEFVLTADIIKLNPANFTNSLAFVRNSAKISGATPGKGRLSFEFAQWHNVNSLYATPHRNVSLGTLELMYPFGESGWMTVFTITASQYGKRDRNHIPIVERDGRVLLVRKDPYESGPWLVPNVKFTLRWHPSFRW